MHCWRHTAMQNNKLPACETRQPQIKQCCKGVACTLWAQHEPPGASSETCAVRNDSSCHSCWRYCRTIRYQLTDGTISPLGH
jgi:hypothetical protein